MTSPNDDGFQHFSHPTEWDQWLAAHHQEANEAWLLILKKGSAGKGLAIGDALDVALCHGWIDSHRRGHNKTHFLQRYSSRRAKSPWSKLNVQRAEALIAEGRMQPAGFAEIAAAKADGRWAVAYEPQRDAEIPEDVVEALAGNKKAAKTFESLSKSARYALVLPVLKATTAEVRARRLKKMINSLEAVK
jgi:uncharacterized protein YdeI (YjbR/CyaY-like superfamily)